MRAQSTREGQVRPSSSSSRLAVAVVGTAAGFSAASSSATRRADAPERAHPHDRRPESSRYGVMGNVRGLLATNGTTFANNFVSYFRSAARPGRRFLTGQYAHNHGVREPAADRRLQPPRQHEHPARCGYSSRLPHRARRQVPERLRPHGRRPAGVRRVVRLGRPDDVPLLELHARTRTALFVTYGTRPEDYQTDVYAQKAVDIVRRLAPSDQPFYLKVAFLAPHSGAPRTDGDPPGASGPSRHHGTRTLAASVRSRSRRR